MFVHYDERGVVQNPAIPRAGGVQIGPSIHVRRALSLRHTPCLFGEDPPLECIILGQGLFRKAARIKV